ncbi:SH3 domain-containing protein [Gemmobacter serpentinus]|uniref:SH3 domain-containing protein n=1 Tax=Gemmobacter serpentinus TaxID=2652247 RepID=UPI00124C7AB1|nr:SH3 domain-containing protein [Gemmobacter serpentinus]
MMRALALCLMLAGPAAADGLPALYDVQGVADWDVLNVRAEPSSRAAVVAQLAPDARAVEVVRQQGNWGQVNKGDGAGWVYMKYMARRTGEDWWQIQDALHCFGTEPFWSLTLRPRQGDARREEPGLPAQTLALGAVSGADGQAYASFGDAAQGGDLRLEAGSCSDGMSDRSYGIRVAGHLRPGLAGTAGEASLSGCCSVEP